MDKSPNYKLNKYTHKISILPKTNYIYKLSRYITQIGGVKLDDIDSLLYFLKEQYNKAPNKTKNRYFVILYGPPGSGKSTSRYLSCHLIKKYFKEDLNVNSICTSFIDTGIDDITYEVEIDNIKVRDLLKNNLRKHIKDNIQDKREYVKQHIDELVKTSFEIYRKHRPDEVSELLFYFSVFLNKNIFMEISSGDTSYINNIVTSMGYYNYIPIFIYPLVKDVNILYKRAIGRGLREGRFLKCDGPYGLADKMTECLKEYENIKDTIKKRKEYIIMQYDANLPNYIFIKVKKKKLKDIDEFNKFVINMEYKINNNTKFYDKKDYDVNLSLNCE